MKLRNKIFTFILCLSCTSALGINQYLKLRLKNFRDPFKRANLNKKDEGRNKKIKSFYTNKVNINNVSIDSLKITGVYLGKERRAIAVDELNKEPFIIKEGMKLGSDKVEVKAILPGGIVLVEKIINIYDELEYLETIIPVTE